MAHQVGTAKYEARVSKTAAEVMVALEQVHVQVEVVVAQVIGGQGVRHGRPLALLRAQRCLS